MNLASLTRCFVDVQKMDCAALVSLMKMGAKVQRLHEVKDKVATTARAGLTGLALPNDGGRAAFPVKAGVDHGRT